MYVKLFGLFIIYCFHQKIGVKNLATLFLKTTNGYVFLFFYSPFLARLLQDDVICGGERNKMLQIYYCPANLLQ